MKICQIEHGKSESIREINEDANLDNASIIPAQNCFKVVDGEKLPIYIRRVSRTADKYLFDYVFKKYGPK
jgi:hypothetical protein